MSLGAGEDRARGGHLQAHWAPHLLLQLSSQLLKKLALLLHCSRIIVRNTVHRSKSSSQLTHFQIPTDTLNVHFVPSTLLRKHVSLSDFGHLLLVLVLRVKTGTMVILRMRRRTIIIIIVTIVNVAMTMTQCAYQACYLGVWAFS